MRPIGIPEIQTKLTEAFTNGLIEAYGPALGTLGREIILYQRRGKLDSDKLRSCMELDSTPVLQAIVANKVTGSTLLGVRSLMIGAALLDDRAGVVRWATEGRNRCAISDNGWPETAPQWQSVLTAPDQFIQLARQIKYFMNQI